MCGGEGYDYGIDGAGGFMVNPYIQTHQGVYLKSVQLWYVNHTSVQWFPH